MLEHQLAITKNFTENILKNVAGYDFLILTIMSHNCVTLLQRIKVEKNYCELCTVINDVGLEIETPSLKQWCKDLKGVLELASNDDDIVHLFGYIDNQQEKF